MKLHFLLAALLAANSFSASAQQVKEKLNRAPVAVKTSQGILVSWRSLTSDAKNLAFDVYRNGKKVASAVSDVTGYLDANGKPGDTYRIVSSAGETSEAIAWNSMFTTFDVKRPASIKSGNTTGRYRPDDMAVGDLDGDGNYELILKWMPDNQRDSGKDGYASPVIISAYRMDGTPLWEKNINLGLNVRSGNHTTQMVVYDFDGDGKAEMIKDARQTSDELGKFKDMSEEERQEISRIVGLGALKYFILKVDARKNMLFNPEESIDFNGNTGPFIQYTYARIRSIMRKAAAEGIEIPAELGADAPINEKEIDLIQKMNDFAVAVADAGNNYNPGGIANYCYELTKEFNQFYHDYSILNAESEAEKITRLVLAANVAKILKNGMALLGIEVPERM